MYILLGNDYLGNFFAEVITIKTLFSKAIPRQLPTAEVNFEGCHKGHFDNFRHILLSYFSSHPV